jgi:hypothetical protein
LSIFRIEAYAKQAATASRVLYFLLIAFGLPFYPEDGGNTFLRNGDELLSVYTASHPRLYALRRENLKSNKDVDCAERG